METTEKKEVRIKKDKSCHQRSRSEETEEKKQARLARKRLNQIKIRSVETVHIKKARLEQDKNCHTKLRSEESDIQRNKRLKQDKVRHAVAKSLEDTEQKNFRRKSDRIRKCAFRVHLKQIDRFSEKRAQNSKEISITDSGNIHNINFTQFEIYQKSLNWNECKDCLEKFIKLKTVAGVCRRCLKFQGHFNKFSFENDMDPGTIPKELSNLSMIEEQLIARVHPVISVYKLRGGQLGYSGQVINFPQDIHEIAKVLPKRINDLTSIIVFRRNMGSDHIDFMVNRNRIYNALLWLKNHNIYYNDIELDYDSLNSLPDNGNVLDIISSETEDKLMHEDKNDSCHEDENDVIISTTDAPDLLPRNNEAVIRNALGVNNPLPWPSLIPVPVNEFTHTGYIAMAFPTLFPKGVCDLRAVRQQRISPVEYFRHLILYKDQRFAKHSRFRFFAMNSLMRWEALKKGKLCVQKNSEFRHYTVEQLKQALESNPGIIRKLLAFNSSLRGSSTYWFTRSRELLDMVKFLGPPTIFLTLSAADLYWPEAFKLVQDDNRTEHLPENEILKLRRIILNENPLIFSYFFKERAEFFIHRVICPKLKVKDFWYRTEFQHRGSPHIHGIFWLEGAPDVLNLDDKTEEEKDAIAKYFGEIICTMNPNFNAPKPPIHPCSLHYSEVTDHEMDYVNLLNACQRHTKHGPQCLRKLKKSGEEVCRFKFPFNLEEKTHLSKENGKWILRTKRNDSLMNNHNRYITEHWRANTDIQPILSIDAVLNYIAKYASKSETKSHGLESLIQDALHKSSTETASVKSVIQRIFTKICSERDYSAQESFYILMGWPLYHSSREFVRLNIEEDKWITIDENKEIGGMQTSLYEAYPIRTSELEELSMHDFFSLYYKKGSTLVKRRKAAVVRVLPKLKDSETENEKFYKQQVIVRVPWRRISDLTGLGSTWKDIYENCIPKTDDTYTAENLTEEFETQEELKEHQEKEDWMVLAGLGEKEINFKVGSRLQDVNFNWNASYSTYESPVSLPSFIYLQKSRADSEEKIHFTSMPKVILSLDQSSVLNILKQQIEFVHGKSIIPPQSVIVQGPAGSGKSTVIQAMTHVISEKIGSRGYLLLAPTGAAALNISGSTIHSALHIGNEREHKPLSSELLYSFQCELKECRFIIIDEMSMLGCALLKKIDLRCREAKPDYANEPFGGLYVYILGDIKQLPPVMDRPLYGGSYKGSIYDQGQLLYKTFEKCVILKSCHRQQGKSQERFRKILNNLSIGQASIDDWKYLMTRNITCLSQEEVKHFNDSIRLFSTNAEVQQYNMKKLENLNCPVAVIPAQHNNKDATKYDQDIFQGLESCLYLSIGARIILRTNLWTEKGLVNGALGTIKDIVYKPDSKPPQDFPIAILVEFDHYTGPSINYLVPIPPVSRTCTIDEKTFSRTQFPLSLAWAITIHKSQGLTLPKAVVNIGERELMLGITYVALSRVRSIKDLMFDPGFSYDRLENIKKSKLLILRLDEEKRLLNLR